MVRTVSNASGYLLCFGGELVRCVIIYRFTGCNQWFVEFVRDLEEIE